MMIRLLSISVFPLQAAASTAPSALQVATEISTVVIAAISVILLVIVLLFLVQLKRLLGSLQRHVGPVTDRARVAAENVEYVTALVRQDVQKVHTSVSGLSDRLGEASERMEERVEEFNALMDVVQDEAESVLLDTAALVQGVRAGAKSVGGNVVGAPPGGAPREPAPVQGGEDSEADDAGEDQLEHEVGEAMTGEAPERG